MFLTVVVFRRSFCNNIIFRKKVIPYEHIFTFMHGDNFAPLHYIYSNTVEHQQYSAEVLYIVEMSTHFHCNGTRLSKRNGRCLIITASLVFQ